MLKIELGTGDLVPARFAAITSRAVWEQTNGLLQITNIGPNVPPMDHAARDHKDYPLVLDLDGGRGRLGILTAYNMSSGVLFINGNVRNISNPRGGLIIVHGNVGSILNAHALSEIYVFGSVGYCIYSVPPTNPSDIPSREIFQNEEGYGRCQGEPTIDQIYDDIIKSASGSAWMFWPKCHHSDKDALEEKIMAHLKGDEQKKQEAAKYIIGKL